MYIDDKPRIEEYTEGFKCPNLAETKYSLQREGASSQVVEMQLDGLIISYREAQIEKEFSIVVTYDFSLLKMHFELEGLSSFYSSDKNYQNIIIPGGYHQFFYHPKVHGTLRYSCNRKSFEVMLTPLFLQKHFGPDLCALDHITTAISANKQALLNSTPLPITPKIKYIIQDILKNTFLYQLKANYIENKIVELLLEQLNQHSQSLMPATKIKNAEKIAQAKHFIEQNIGNTITLTDIAKEVGINSFLLKTEFKNQFLYSPIAYHSELRLTYAHNELRKGFSNVSEIAYKIGYKNPQHFTTAFKKKFGYCPSELKK